MPNKDINKTNDIYNFYEHAEVKKMIKKVHNPCKEVHQLDLPFRILICGSSGSGKTSILLNLISKCQDTFGKIYIVCKAQEPLYEYLEKNLNTKGKKKVIICTKLSELPSIHNFPDKELQQLIVFDDYVADPEASQTIIKEFFIRARKIGAGVSLVYLSQSYFKVPRLIRLQMGYLFLLKLSSSRDLNMVLSECSLGDSVDRKDLLEVYKEATQEKFSFLKIDLETSDPNRKFSKNFSDFYKLE